MMQLIKSNFIERSSVIFCDVLADMAFHDFPIVLPQGSALSSTIISLEQELLESSQRHSQEQLQRRLHPRFAEVGASGRVYDREAIIAQLAREPARDAGALKVESPVALQLSDQLVLLRWKLLAGSPSERSSLWIHEQGRWQLLFHQGTAAAHPQPSAGPEEAVHADGEFSVRRLRLSDAEAVYEAFSSNPDMLRQGDADSPQKAESYVRALLEAGERQQAMAVAYRDRLVGLVCGTVDPANRNAWIWYWMNQNYRGRSLATRAVATLVDYLFDELGLYRLELGLRANNPGSKHVAESNGFLHEGVERGKFLVAGERIDVHTYARLRTDGGSAVMPLPWGTQQ
ncbi:GNAT family N-acetyltransferase [Glutamicibacter sp.]|uniref:GNAT family N-acetyltransferase n=1 Tax=Glutamicibacter sp. TaxID=1931995 RepID=UPI002FC8EF20